MKKMKTKFTTVLIALLLGMVNVNAQENLLTDPSFENTGESLKDVYSTFDWVTPSTITGYWFSWKGGDIGSLFDSEEEDTYVGSKSLILLEGNNEISQLVVSENKKYKASIRYKCLEKVSTADIPITLSINYHTGLNFDYDKTFTFTVDETNTPNFDDGNWHYAEIETDIAVDITQVALVEFTFVPYGWITLIDDATLTTVDGAGSINVTEVSLDKTTASLTVGNTEQLTATVAPENASNKNISWASSNTNVATVDANGLVTAVAAGTADITVTTEDGNFTATCALTVSAAQTDNLMSNPGFEDGTTSWLLDYATIAEFISDEVHSGNNSLIAQGSLYHLTNNYDFTSFFNKTFTISFWYKSVEGEAKIGLNLQAYNEGLTDLLWVGEVKQITLSVINNGWQQVTATFEPINSNKDLRPYSLLALEVNINDASILIDDFSLTVTPIDGLSEVRTQLPVRIQNGNIIVTAPSGSPVEVFNALGIKLQSQTANSSETKLSNLPKSQVLIVRSGNAVAKSDIVVS